MERQFQAAVFKEYLRNKLIALLDSVPGKKMLLLEEETSEALQIVAKLSLLYEHGVAEQGGINFVSRGEPIDKSITNVLALITPSIKAVNFLIEICRKSQEKNLRRNYVVAFWPRRTVLVRAHLETLGLANLFELRDFAFDLLPLENDLYSLQMKSFRQIFLERDYSYYGYVAESIHRLQSVYGKIHNVYGKGNAAKVVVDILRQKEEEIKLDGGYGEIQTLVVIDRSIDFLTPAMKQLVYEGLIDDIYGITGVVVKVPLRVFEDKERDESKMKPLLLQGESDPIFQLIREKNIQVCMPVLSKKLGEIKEMQDSLKAGQGSMRSAAEMLKKMDLEKTLSSRHISIVDSVLKHVKEIDFQKEIMMEQRAIVGTKEKELLEYCEVAANFAPPLHRLLRLLAIASLTDKGLPPKVLRQLSFDLVQIYGLSAICTLSNLVKIGLLSEKDTPGCYPFEQIRKEMKLLSDAGINYENPQDISFAFGGFAPLTCRLVQEAIRHNWRALGKAFKHIPGETVIPTSVSVPSSARPVVLVYFVGGVTYSEVQALRVLGRLQNKELVVLTTQMLNGDKMIKSLID